MRVFLTRKDDKYENPLLPWEKNPVKLFKQTANCFKGLIIQGFYFQICLFISISYPDLTGFIFRVETLRGRNKPKLSNLQISSLSSTVKITSK